MPKILVALATAAFDLLTAFFILLHSAHFIFVGGIGGVARPVAAVSKSQTQSTGGSQRCEERLNGSIIRKATALSGVTTARMFSCIIQPSPVTAIELYRKETR